METFSYLRYGCYQKLFVAFLQLAFIFVGKALVDGAIFDVDIVDKCVLVAVVVHDSKYIYIGNGVAYNLAFASNSSSKIYFLLYSSATSNLRISAFSSSYRRDICLLPVCFPSESHEPGACFPDILRSFAC